MSAWINKLFGYGLSVSKSEGHISIKLIEQGIEFNIVDTGYGVSQILPVLAQIWWARERLRTGPHISSHIVPTILSIEQPEASFTSCTPSTSRRCFRWRGDF